MKETYIGIVALAYQAMQLRCGGMFDNHVIANKFPTECNSERILHIHQYLAKILAKVWWHVSYGPSQCRT